MSRRIGTGGRRIRVGYVSGEPEIIEEEEPGEAAPEEAQQTAPAGPLPYRVRLALLIGAGALELLIVIGVLANLVNTVRGEPGAGPMSFLSLIAAGAWGFVCSKAIVYLDDPDKVWGDQ